MREICQSGSEGGGVGTTGAPYPYHACAARSKKIVDAGLRRHDAEGGGRASIIMLPGMRWLRSCQRHRTIRVHLRASALRPFFFCPRHE